jgi:hypothetical protein
LSQSGQASQVKPVVAAVGAPGTKLAKPIDWNNRTYGLTCGGTVKKPVAVAIRHGKGIARGSRIGAYDHWEVEVQRIARGDLPGAGNITAVLFLCTPQSSNFYVQEVHVYRTGDGTQVGGTPRFDVPGLPPVYVAASLAVTNGRLVDDVMFYGPKDSHASGPSILRHVTWAWDGRSLVTHM